MQQEQTPVEVEEPAKVPASDRPTTLAAAAEVGEETNPASNAEQKTEEASSSAAAVAAADLDWRKKFGFVMPAATVLEEGRAYGVATPAAEAIQVVYLLR